MKVKIKMSSLLRQLSQLPKEPDTTYVSAPNPIECLQNMADRFPSLKKWVYDNQGRVTPQVQFFVNGEKLLADEFASPLNDGDELFIVLAIGGG
jgi:hypothetical protein